MLTWNSISLHIPIWIGIFVIGWKFGGGGAIPLDVETATAVVDIEWQRCGQYGLKYFEADNGFYNCLKE